MIYPNKIEAKMPEMWLPVNLHLPNVCPYYLISSYGRVYNDYTRNFLPKNIYYNKDKYINIRLSTIDGNHIQEMIQRIVMYTFSYIPGCEKLDVNHKDGIKYHNWLWNLEWTTHKENMDHAWNNNLFVFGEERKNTKLTNEQARDICLMLSHGISPKEISKIYMIPGVNVEKIAFNIVTRHSWKHISKEYNIPRSFRKGKSSTTIESYKMNPIEFV